MGILQACWITASLIGSEPAEPPVIPPLIAALADRDLEVRCYAGAALAELGPVAVDPLIVAVQNQDRYQRAGAAYALGRLGGVARPAKAQLLRALTDEDRDVRRQAAYALSRILAAEHDEVQAPPSPPSALPAPIPAPEPR